MLTYSYYSSLLRLDTVYNDMRFIGVAAAMLKKKKTRQGQTGVVGAEPGLNV